jgi:hypothetical protein
MKPIFWRKGRFPLKVIVSDLLEDVICSASANAERFIKNTQYTTFTYGERQMTSILAPAFHIHTDGMILEYPSTRKRGVKNHPARADFYCYCHNGLKDYRLFVELKSGYQVLPLTNGFDDVNTYLYEQACDDIRGLINEVRGANRDFYSGVPVVRVGLVAIPLFSSGEDDDIKIDGKKIVKEASKQFTYKSPDMDCNLIGYWKVDKRLRESFKQEWEGDNCTLQGILYVCHIMESITV